MSQLATTQPDPRAVSRRRFSSFLVFGGLVASVVSCGGGGDPGGGPTPPPPPPAVTAVAVSPGTLALQGVGATGTLSAALTPSTAVSAISWTSSSPAIATVSGSAASATITAVAAGTVTITATSAGISGSATVTVTPLVRALSLTPATYAVNVGATVRLAPTITADAGASQVLVWSSSAIAVATIDQSGNVAGVAPGTATITIASQAFPAVTTSATVMVSFPVVRSVIITPSAPSILQGGTRQFAAVVDADAGTSTAVTWTSTSTDVATVSASGLLTATSPGSTTLRAISAANPTVNGATVVTVLAPTVRGVIVAPATTTAIVGTTRQLNATVDADAGANTAVTWMSSNPAIAQVSATGLVTALAPGGATLRATSVLVPTVSGTASITVATPPPLTAWMAQPSLPPSTMNNAFQFFGYSLSNGTAWTAATLPAGDRSMLRFNGSTWSTVSAAPFDQANGLGGFGDNAWLGSRAGRLARLNIDGSGAQTWVEMSSPTAQEVIRIIGTSATTAVAATTQQVLTLSAGTWSLIAPPGVALIVDAAATASNNIVVAASSAAGGSRLRRWNGTSWSVIPDAPNTGSLSEVEFFGSSIVVTDEGLSSAIYNGTSWSVLSVPAPRAGTTSENFVRLEACGGQLYSVANTGGRVFRLNGTSWVTVADYGASIPGGRNMRTMCGSDEVLRVLGPAGSISRYTGTTWVQELSSMPVTRVVLLRPDLAWAVAFGQIRRWDGARWTVEQSEPSYFGESDLIRANGLGAAPDGTVMATPTRTDQRAGVFRRTPNGNWNFDALAVRCSDVWTASSTFALAVGFGCGVRWDGSAWSPVTGLPTTPISVSGFSPSDALAVGWTGSVSASSRWNGSTWTPLPTPNVGLLRAVRVASATLAYALGDNGMLRWDGTQWNAVSIPGTMLAAFPLRDMSVNSVDDVYAVARTGAVYRFNGANWELATTVSGAVGDVAGIGATSIATIPGYGIIGSGAGFAFHSNSLSALRMGIPTPFSRSGAGAANAAGAKADSASLRRLAGTP